MRRSVYSTSLDDVVQATAEKVPTSHGSYLYTVAAKSYSDGGRERGPRR